MKTRNKALIITGVIVFAIGLVLFLIGALINGWDFIAFFHSHTFIWICVLLGIYVLFAIILLVKEWYSRL